MRLRHVAAAAAWVGAVTFLVQCGSSPATPTANPTPGGVTPSATPTASPTPGGSSGLPAGMVCSSPTPPPILRMHVKVHDDGGDRKVLDSKPLVVNIDNYCDKVGFGDWKFCDTRPEGHPERVACDYLVTGKAEDTGRWGPTWFFGNDLCAYFPASCANHATEQFMAVAKTKGTFEACAADGWPVASNGTRCGTLELK
jgi:hypothetical protein